MSSSFTPGKDLLIEAELKRFARIMEHSVVRAQGLSPFLSLGSSASFS